MFTFHDNIPMYKLLRVLKGHMATVWDLAIVEIFLYVIPRNLIF